MAVLLRQYLCHLGRLLFEELAGLFKEKRLQLSYLSIISLLNLMSLLSHQLLNLRVIEEFLAVCLAQIGVRARVLTTLKVHHAHATST